MTAPVRTPVRAPIAVAVLALSMVAGAPVHAQTIVSGAAPPPLSVPPQPATQPPLPLPPGATEVTGDRATARIDRDIRVEGNAELRRDGTRLRGECITYDQDTDEVVAVGNVRLSRDGTTFRGPEARLKVDAVQGRIEQPVYTVGQTGGGGHADSIEFLEPGRYRASNGTYTTCSGPTPDWMLRANKIDIDDDRKVGTGEWGKLYFFDVPVAAAPAFAFPLSEERRSGFLPPLMGLTSVGGVDLTLPYYFNLAPNRDLTVYPRLVARRGLQLGGEFRYLEPAHTGTLRTEYLDDRLSNDRRWSYSWQHQHALGAGVSAYANVSRVSDDRYPDDLGRSLALAVQRQYTQEAGLSWSSGYWSTLLRTQQFQTLAPAGPAYERVPQLNAKYFRQDVNGFDFSFEADATHFRNPNRLAQAGRRIYASPQISYPFIAPGYFVVPRVMAHASSYALGDMADGGERRMSRVLPTASLDAGLIFERKTRLLGRWLGRELIQTLEPRLFYVYTPYRDQSTIPLFDTAALDFGAAQIFTENPFVGHDRIADNNKLTSGLSTRLIEVETGVERARFTVAQRFDFNGQKVALAGNQFSESKLYSDLLFAGSAQMLARTNLDAAVQYNPEIRRVMRSSVGVSWRPEPRKVLNVAYRYKRPLTDSDPNALEQVDLSTLWPLTARLYGVGRLNYDLRSRAAVDTLAGFEYDGGCWVGRVVLQRFANAQQNVTTHAYFQLELRGFSQVGSSAAGILRLNVPGYTPPEPQPVALPVTPHEE